MSAERWKRELEKGKTRPIVERVVHCERCKGWVVVLVRVGWSLYDRHGCRHCGHSWFMIYEFV